MNTDKRPLFFKEPVPGMRAEVKYHVYHKERRDYLLPIS